MGNAGEILSRSPYGVYIALGIALLLLIGWYVRRKR